MKFNLKLENIKYIKINCEKDNGDLITIKTGIKSFTDSQIVLLSKYSNTYENIFPQEISANIFCDDGVYTLKAQIKKIENVMPYTIFTLDSLEEINYKQNREYFRIQYITECVCETNLKGEISFHNGKIINLSANGIKAVFPNCFITNGNCKLSFKIENTKLELLAHYIRSENYNDEYQVSFSFIKINETDREIISRFCIKKQLEQRRKNLF